MRRRARPRQRAKPRPAAHACAPLATPPPRAGRDEFGHSYIYRCLDWSYPIAGGRYNARGKLLFFNFFIGIPIFNFLYWLLIWARRRTLTLYKKAAEPLTITITSPRLPRTLQHTPAAVTVADAQDLRPPGISFCVQWVCFRR